MSSIGGAFPNNRVSLAWINDLAKTAPEELVSCSEAQFEGQLDQVVGHLNQLDPTPQVVALAGPSSSGKTTCAHKLCSRLTRRGIPCQRISLDDFYLGDGRYPLRADGSADVESIESLDLAAFHRCMVELLETGSTLLPVFDFVARQPAAQGRLCRLPPNGIVVVEGLHALNPRLAEARAPLPALCPCRHHFFCGGSPRPSARGGSADPPAGAGFPPPQPRCGVHITGLVPCDGGGMGQH